MVWWNVCDTKPLRILELGTSIKMRKSKGCYLIRTRGEENLPSKIRMARKYSFMQVSGLKATTCSVPATLISVLFMDLLATMAPAVTLPKKVQRKTLPINTTFHFPLTPDNSSTVRSFTWLLLRPNPTQSLGGRTKEMRNLSPGCYYTFRVHSLRRLGEKHPGILLLLSPEIGMGGTQVYGYHSCWP